MRHEGCARLPDRAVPRHLRGRLPRPLPEGKPPITPMEPLIAELLGTFALALVVLNVATAKANASNSFYGLAIGFTVVAASIFIGGSIYAGRDDSVRFELLIPSQWRSFEQWLRWL